MNKPRMSCLTRYILVSINQICRKLSAKWLEDRFALLHLLYICKCQYVKVAEYFGEMRTRARGCFRLISLWKLRRTVVEIWNVPMNYQ
jgi:hypothetical protein